MMSRILEMSLKKRDYVLNICVLNSSNNNKKRILTIGYCKMSNIFGLNYLNYEFITYLLFSPYISTERLLQFLFVDKHRL